ncbi:MAG: HAD-IA family hydrolase [Gammaproteobacteria bacterium]|nr:HAD-IA family hydrolase [Gammaproteobacteria bacterium]NNL52179.1 HAD-IA family hydrolase [Woeseiaceae bacterium]
MRSKLVIFDCDGVLVDSEKLGNDVFAEMLADYGHRISGDESIRRFRGVNVTKCLEILQRETGLELPESFEADLRQRMSSVFKAQLRPVDGALRLVESLQVPFCVASSGPRKKIEENLQTTNLYPHFAGKIFSGYEIGSWKPDPGLFLLAARHFGVAPEECVVVEDSFVGVSAGIAANMTVLALDAAVDSGGLAMADRIFGSLDEMHGFFVSQNLSHK